MSSNFSNLKKELELISGDSAAIFYEILDSFNNRLTALEQLHEDLSINKSDKDSDIIGDSKTEDCKKSSEDICEGKTIQHNLPVI